MRILYFWFAAALFTVFAMARGNALAEEQPERSTVPYSLSQIQDETLRSALSMYKPGYDTLPRQEQVGSFVNLYTSLHNVPPELSGADAALNAAHTAALSAPIPFVSRWEPWHDPTWYPGKGIGILGLGLHSFHPNSYH
jgi:hypothetical protein